MRYFNTAIKFVDESGNFSYGCWGSDDEYGRFIPDEPDIDVDEINPLESSTTYLDYIEDQGRDPFDHSI